MKPVMMIVMTMVCCSAFGIYSRGRVTGPKPGEGRRLDSTLIDRSKNKASTNAVVIAGGVWKERPGGLFGKKFGEVISGKIKLSGDKDERHVAFQPEKRFRKFGNYRQLVDPRTRIVYGLTCTAKFREENDAKAEVETVKGILKQKFPKGWQMPKLLQVGYGEGGDGGMLGPYWTVAVTMIAPKSKQQIGATYEVVIRAVDDHFFPPEVVAPSAPSANLEAL